jgi:hypothetical protein
MLASIIRSLASGELSAIFGRVRRTAIMYILTAASVLCAIGFLLAAGFMLAVR